MARRRGQEDRRTYARYRRRSGSLIVEVEDVVWQRQLNTLRHFLLRNLADALGEAWSSI